MSDPKSFMAALIKSTTLYIDGKWVETTRFCKECQNQYPGELEEKEEPKNCCPSCKREVQKKQKK